MSAAERATLRTSKETSVMNTGTPKSRRDRTLLYLLLICLVVYLFSAKGYLEVSDTSYSLQTAEAIVNHGQLNIPSSDSTLQGPDGRSYSKYGFGLPLYFVPFVAAGKALSGVTRLPAQQLIEFLISFGNIPFGVFALVLFARLLRFFGITEANAHLLLAGLGLGTLAWRYSVSDFSEAMQMCVLLLAVYCVIRRSRPAIIAGGIAFAWLVLVKLIYVVFFPIFAIYLLTRPGELRNRIRILALFTLPFILICCFIGWLNADRFGNPLQSGYGHEAEEFFPGQMWLTVPKLLGSLDKGIFIFCPVLILGIFGWRAFFRKHRAEALLCAVLIALNLFWASAWHAWQGGWSWGPRLLVPMIPLWLLPGAFLMEKVRGPRMRMIFSLVTLASIITQIPGVLVKDQEIHQIKENLLTPAEQAAAPSDYVAAYLLLRHKLFERNEIYPLSELHIPGTRQLDLSVFRTFRGLNVWTELTARQFNKPALRWLPLLGLLVVICLLIQLWRSAKVSLAQSQQLHREAIGN
jgi:hypothetical protein